MKILITGGHVTPALAVIDELEGHEIVFVGRKYAVSGEAKPSFEYQETKKRGIRFVDLKAGRFTRVLTLSTLVNLFRIPLGFFRAFKIVRRENPDIILSFGGYLALPIAFWGYMLNIPVFTHEQTIVPGLTNKLIGKIANKTFVSFPEAQKYFPQGKSVHTGNPVRKGIFTVKDRPFEIDSQLQTIFISGGALGSHSVNKHIKNILPQLLEKFQVIHQTGSVEGEDDISHLQEIREKLPENLKQRYFLKEHFLEDEFGFIYAVCDFIVGRAGANTFFELLAVKKPAIFIPLPWASGDEQQKQAELFGRAGAGEIFDQRNDSKILFELILKVSRDPFSYKVNFKNLSNLNKPDAAKNIAREILRSK